MFCFFCVLNKVKSLPPKSPVSIKKYVIWSIEVVILFAVYLLFGT
ncbi:MAG: hypothetical protein RIS29_272 [Bacteroidota bacterium]|jgi:hypothetical protein